MKKLYKDESHSYLLGVLAGFARYLNIDATVVRVVYVAASAFLGVWPGIVIYVVMAAIVPDESHSAYNDYKDYKIT